MSTSQIYSTEQVTPPSSLVNDPLTPPSTDEKQFAQVHRVIALFKEIKARRHIKLPSWTVFQLAEGDYDEIERQLQRDEELWRFVDDKIRYDYSERSNRLIVRMPSAIHELFIAQVEDAIWTQLKVIRNGLGKTAQFAEKVVPARSSRIKFSISRQSKYEPDSQFWHDDAKYAGVIIEISYAQKRKDLARLADDYILDSNASVRVLVGLDVGYGKKKSRKATLSIWRPRLDLDAADGPELRVFKEIADEAFRDDEGNPTNHAGLRLSLRDFACEALVQDEIGDEDAEICISTTQLCQYLTAAEDKMRRLPSLAENSLPNGVKKKRRSETPPEEIGSEDEAKYVEQERRAAKRTEDQDKDYTAE